MQLTSRHSFRSFLPHTRPLACTSAFCVPRSAKAAQLTPAAFSVQRIYPSFDPLGLAKGGLGRTGEELKAAEIKNGRCAPIRSPWDAL